MDCFRQDSPVSVVSSVALATFQALSITPLNVLLLLPIHHQLGFNSHECVPHTCGHHPVLSCSCFLMALPGPLSPWAVSPPHIRRPMECRLLKPSLLSCCLRTRTCGFYVCWSLEGRQSVLGVYAYMSCLFVSDGAFLAFCTFWLEAQTWIFLPLNASYTCLLPCPAESTLFQFKQLHGDVIYRNWTVQLFLS